MNDFKTILSNLKHIISKQQQAQKRVLDRDVAQALSIKSTNFAGYKIRNKPPYKAILIYCHNNHFDVTKVLFDENIPVATYPPPIEANEEGKVYHIKYFRTLAAYALYLGKHKP